jgi:hypothetical protein
VALTVTFTVCDAEQIGLSPSEGLCLPLQNLVILQAMLPEQKAPPFLAPWFISNQAYVSRKQAVGEPAGFDASKCFRYALISPSCWLNVLGSQPNSAESTRGPPRMDPPIPC